MAFFATTDYVGPVSSPAGHLREIAAFLKATPDAWTQNKEGRDGNGRSTDPLSPWARSWCLLGLMERFIRDSFTRQVALGMVMRVMPTLKGTPVPVHAFNDSTGRKLGDVIVALERASAIAPVAPMGQDEYCFLSRAYSRALACDAEFTLPKLPDWKVYFGTMTLEPESDPIMEAKKALQDFDSIMASFKREACMSVAA